MTRAGAARHAAGAVAASLLVGSLGPAHATQSDADPLPVRVAVQEMSSFLAPDDTFTLRARLVSGGAETLDRVQVRLRLGGAVGSRSELRELADNPPVGGDVVLVDDDAVPDELAPGDVAAVDVQIPAQELAARLGRRNGVHPLRIEVRARAGAGNRVQVGVADTFLPWWPEPTERTRIAWMWPLVADDPRAGDGRFRHDGLADDVDAEGRLDTLLDVGAAAADRVPVTWVVDPALADALAAMADGYSVVTPSGSQAAGSGRAAASAWLGRARAALSDPRSRVIALPYGDPDVAALTRAGLRDVTATALETGRRVLADQDLPPGEPDLAWPPAGAVDVPTLGVLAVHGVRHVVVADTSLRLADDGDSTATPSAATTLESVAARPVVAVAADGELSRLVADGPSAGGTAEGTRLALQRIVAETAFFTLERPSESRDLVVAPPRTWNPAGPFAAGLLDLTASVPWLRADVVTNVATRPRDDVDRFLVHGAEQRDAELPASVLTAAGVERDRVEQFRSMLVPGRGETPDPVPAQLDLAVLRSVSAGLRGRADEARAIVDDVSRVLTERFNRVSVARGGLITMGGDTARVPITLVNDLDTTVRVQVRIDTRNRLALPEGTVREEVVAPGRRQLQIAAQALVPGDFVIAVSLATPDGRALPGGPTTLRVRSSAYGKVALIITIGAFVLLLLGSATRLARRRRRATPDDGPETPVPAGTAGSVA